MFKNIQTVIEKILKKQTKKDYIEYKEIQQKWKNQIEDKIQKNAKIIDFTKGTITIKAQNPSWKNELIFMQEDIKKNFQAKKTQ